MAALGVPIATACTSQAVYSGHVGGILLYPTAYTSTKKHFEQFWDGLVQSCVRKLNIFQMFRYID